MSGRSDPGTRQGGSWRDDRAWQAGLLIGSALGAAATVVGRRMEDRAREGLVDWPAVERIAIDRLRGAPGTLTPADLRAAEPAYLAAMERIVPALSATLGAELPGVVERCAVVDRAGWVRANTSAFEALIGKLESDLLDQVIPAGGGLAKATMALANRWITTRQLGFLLGFMGQRVLGQYDLALLSAIIHQNSYEQNKALYGKIYRALGSGGRIVVRDHVMSADRTQPLEGALFAVNMLAGTEGGRTYTFDEIKEGLTAVGFTRINLIQTKGMFSLVEGFKP